MKDESNVMNKPCGQSCFVRRPLRAFCKACCVAAVIALVFAGLSFSINDSALDQIKFDLSLWSLIALVLIINFASLLAFGALYLAYRWMRTDLKPPRVEDIGDQDPNNR